MYDEQYGEYAYWYWGVKGEPNKELGCSENTLIWVSLCSLNCGVISNFSKREVDIMQVGMFRRQKTYDAWGEYCAIYLTSIIVSYPECCQHPQVSMLLRKNIDSLLQDTRSTEHAFLEKRWRWRDQSSVGVEAIKM